MTEVECVRLPLVPVIVSVRVPGVVDLVVVTVRVEEPLDSEFDEKVQVAPDGQPLTVRYTLPVKPLAGVTVTE
ncbi:MAG: hypothetical protein M3O94_04405 [Actinomycetota bacterium]|nr:hypothetical protein [Actinomycetota bacterium]